MIGNPAFAVNLIAHPSTRIKGVLSEVQDFLSGCLRTDTLYACPVYSLHMSLFQYVHSRKCNASIQVPIWKKCREQVDMHLKSATKESTVFILESPTLHISESAVTVQFQTSQGIESLRDYLEAEVKPYQLAWNRPTIQHITILRYTSSFRLQQLVSKVSEIDLPNFIWEINTLELVQDNIYPSLDNELIRKYSLG